MTITSLTSMTRRTITMAFSLLLLAVTFMALAGSAGALQPVGNGNGNGDGNGPQNLPPVASFTISPNPALVSSSPVLQQALTRAIPVGPITSFGTGDTVTFNASSSHDDHKILNYEWDLDGNGTFETHGVTATVEKKKYFSTGQFTIRLRVTDAQGLDGVVTHVLTVRHAPHAAISANVAVPLVGQQVTYSAAGSTGDPGVAKYDWDLDGNGTFETSTGTTPSVTTSYQSAGTRTVAVKVTDTLGTTATASLNEIVNQAPIAAFTDAPNPAFVGEVVHFDGSSSSDDDTIADYAWDLDNNGTFETDTHAVPTVTKKFTAPGTITVRLRVTDDHGVTNTVAHTLVIAPAPTTTSNAGTTNNNGTNATNNNGSNNNATNNNGSTDTSAPKVSITPRTVKVSKKGTVTLKVTCPKTERACSGRLSLRSVRGAHSAKLGAGTFAIVGGKTATVRLHLSAANRKLVKRLHTLKAKASAIATDAAGNTATTNATIKIKR
jgi:PKD repeat protein